MDIRYSALKMVRIPANINLTRPKSARLYVRVPDIRHNRQSNQCSPPVSVVGGAGTHRHPHHPPAHLRDIHHDQQGTGSIRLFMKSREKK